jgi:L-2-hydroxyglutarate oxidase
MTHLAIIGGGIVGAATLESLSRLAPDFTLTLLEKEPVLAAHQSGRNSGVVHSGIYYQPGSLKARFCREGKAMLEAFCQQQGLTLERRGKLISASQAGSEDKLGALLDRGSANGVPCRRLSPQQARQLEPRLRSFGAIEVPGTGIADYQAVTERLADVAEARGCQLLLGTEVLGIHHAGGTINLVTNEGSLQVDGYLNCAGLHSDRIARLAGLNLNLRIIPFRGEYFRLKPAGAQDLRGHLIYPLPDAELPFLGVHLTPTLAGDWLLGPNAVLALAREGYSWGRVKVNDIWTFLTFPGFQRLALKFWRYGLAEMLRSLSKDRFARSARQLIEGIAASELEPARSGVRAQLLSASGQLLDDFHIVESPAGIHVLNAPSPAATASLRIGQELASRAVAVFS